MRVPTVYHVPKTRTRKLLVTASIIVCLVVTVGEQRLLEQTHRQLAVSLKQDRVFHKLEEIGNNTNIGIRGITT